MSLLLEPQSRAPQEQLRVRVSRPEEQQDGVEDVQHLKAAEVLGLALAEPALGPGGADILFSPREADDPFERMVTITNSMHGARRMSAVNLKGGAHTVRFKVRIWRAKLVTAVMQLDRDGRVVESAPEDKLAALYPPGEP